MEYGRNWRRHPNPLVWFCDRWMLLEELVLPITMHNEHYASSTFEGIRAYRTRRGLSVFALDQHTQRLFHSMSILRMDRTQRIRVVNFTPPTFEQAILDTVAINDDGRVPGFYVRPLIWYAVDPETGYGLGVDASTVDVWVAILVVPWGKYVSKNLHHGGAKLLVVNRDRPWRGMIDGTAKLACGYGGWSIPAKLDAVLLGCSEAIFAPDGLIKDGTGQEVVSVSRQGVFQYIGARRNNILPSITKQILFAETSPEHRPPCEEVEAMYLDDVNRAGLSILGTASEVTAATMFVYPYEDCHRVAREVEIGNGFLHPAILKLAEFYQRVVHGQYEDYERLHSFVPTLDDVLSRRGQEAFSHRALERLLVRVQ